MRLLPRTSIHSEPRDLSGRRFFGKSGQGFHVSIFSLRWQNMCVKCDAGRFQTTAMACTGQSDVPSNTTQAQAFCLITNCLQVRTFCYKCWDSIVLIHSKCRNLEPWVEWWENQLGDENEGQAWIPFLARVPWSGTRWTVWRWLQMRTETLWAKSRTLEKYFPQFQKFIQGFGTQTHVLLVQTSKF